MTSLQNMRMFIMEHKEWIAGSLLVLILFFSGFSKKMYKIDSCHSTVKKYVTAEYSEITTSIDSEGKSYTDTSYWSEPASEVYAITKIDAMPEYPPMPPHDTSMRHDYDFDNFQFHTDATVKVLASIPSESTIFNVAIQKAKRCLNNIGSVAIVKTWYTITYDSEF